MDRTKEERQNEILPIIKKMNEIGLKITKHEELKDFFEQMKKYIQEGEKIEINIPIQEIGIRIKGILAVNRNERVWVKLEQI
jgi:D-ribose pyranose/furanose isomerase RbsD